MGGATFVPKYLNDNNVWSAWRSSEKELRCRWLRMAGLSRVLLKFLTMMVSTSSVALTLGNLVVRKNCNSGLTLSTVKLFRLSVLTSYFPSCWKQGYIQHVSKKCDCSNPLNYHSIYPQ